MKKRKVTIRLVGGKSLEYEEPTQVALEPNMRFLTIVMTPEPGKIVKNSFVLDNVLMMIDEEVESMIQIPHQKVLAQ